ncbi:hypothetical protein L1785_07620 [Antribacter sp. KLBMP9083]|uniref:Uncharacterized protein n=1 Tax=Antribacter soli TaxID=2910976 RepID=A0AA41QDM0_9MICO|nr:hypothetical protein [Antribacter soli]MCF4120845.1 hypothetical protein [Antribacter soli]
MSRPLTGRTRLADRPLPRVTVETGPTVPGWALRVALGAAAALLLAGAGARTEELSTLLVVPVSLALVTLLVVRPRPAVVGVVLVASGVLLLGSSLAPFDPWALVLAPLAYLVTRLAWWADHVTSSAHAERAALAAWWRRDAVVVAGTLGLGAIALVASGASVAVGVLVGGIALVLLASLVLQGQDGRV